MVKNLKDKYPPRGFLSNRPKSNYWVTVAISFMLAVTLWFMVTLNIRVFSTDVELPVKLTNLPEMVQLRKELPENVSITAKGTGINLLYQVMNVRPDTLEVDFREHGSIGYFYGRSNLSLISRTLLPGLEAIKMKPDSIDLESFVKASKRVPVILRFEYSLAPAFRLVEPLRTKPDTVIVMGPRELLDTLTAWRSVVYVVADPVDNEENYYIPLDTIPPFETIQKEVVVHIHPEKFTEDLRTVKLVKTNVPEGYRLRLSPDTVRVRYLVPVNNFESARNGPIRVVIDYAKIKEESMFAFPEIEVSPDSVEVVEISPPRVKYMIIKER